MDFIINNVSAEKKYQGAYAKIFRILNEDSLFGGTYETDESIGLVGNTYFLQISENPDWDKLERILKIKNVSISNK